MTSVLTPGYIAELNKFPQERLTCFLGGEIGVNIPGLTRCGILRTGPLFKNFERKRGYPLYYFVIQSETLSEIIRAGYSSIVL